MSTRIMVTLGRFVEAVEVYSIDEAFLSLAGYESLYPDLREFAGQLRWTKAHWHLIPVSVGIGVANTFRVNPPRRACKNMNIN
jgi:DNA polymerase V